jgi:ABC-type glutathione transport system ATPase component
MAARAGTRGQRDWTYERVLDTFPRLKERLGHGGQQLSGGEQQMLTIGRALMTNPDVLILDEATEGLAPLIAREIWRICGLIRETGISSVIVDKNWKSRVTQVTDRNVILVKGEVVSPSESKPCLPPATSVHSSWPRSAPRPACSPRNPPRRTAYPSRPVKVIVALPAGGSVDMVARQISQQLTADLGQPFRPRQTPAS